MERKERAMKNGKRILAVLMIALMLLSLSACGFADIPVIKAVVEFAQLSSVHAEPEFELGMKINVPSCIFVSCQQCSPYHDMMFRPVHMAEGERHHFFNDGNRIL